MPKRALKDFTKGVPIKLLRDGEMLGGQIGKDKVLLVRRGEDFFAVGSQFATVCSPSREPGF